ncbi:cupin domain-containing protein [Pirellulaceae bacterium]|jgi:mannose-6-phosphate isomerase-like protein (cupin superfamily)|nr:cupin domain-containing protein [Pirellulaceae bacterium]
MTKLDKFSPLEKFEGIEEYWSPKIAAEFNGQQMRLAKLKGEFVWHSHEHEDEVFFVLDGELKIELRDRTINLKSGEVFVVPRGVEHRPVAESEVRVMLIEPAETVNTGATQSEWTQKNIGWV